MKDPIAPLLENWPSKLLFPAENACCTSQKGSKVVPMATLPDQEFKLTTLAKVGRILHVPRGTLTMYMAYAGGVLMSGMGSPEICRFFSSRFETEPRVGYSSTTTSSAVMSQKGLASDQS